MRARDAVLDYELTKSDAATYEKDLDIVDPISALKIEVSATNGSTSNKGNFVEDIVTRVEIVDGAEVLWSANMLELMALNFYKTGNYPLSGPSEWPDGGQGAGAFLYFGRELWDQEFAFDPKAFRNPQLKITLNKAAVRAASDTTAFKTGDNIKVSVTAKIMENMGGRPSKYLMARAINRWTSATSGERRIELPTDYPYRMMLLRAYVEGSDLNECITDIKLTCDTDKYVMLNRKVNALTVDALEIFGRATVKHDIFVSNDETVRLVMNKEPDCRIAWVDTGLYNIIGIAYQWSSQLKIWIGTHAGAADGTDRKYTMVEEGHCPHAVLAIPFGLLSREDTWFNPREYGKIEAVVTEAVAATCGIVLEQVRPNIKLG
jgi:hypothetical protein